jgi:PAS domain S-box-containing protein
MDSNMEYPIINNRHGNNDFQEDIIREQVRLAMKQLPTMQAASFLVALVLSYAVYDTVPRANVGAWILMVFLIVTGRIVLHFRFVKVRDQLFAGETWKKCYLYLALVSGAIWGLSAFLIFPAGSPWLISLFVLVLASLSAATTVSHSSIRLAPTAWAGPAMLPYAIRCAMEGGETGFSTSVLIVLYLFTILRYSFIHHNTIISAISLKFENLDLLEEVQKAKEGLEVRVEERTVELRDSNESLIRAMEERESVEAALRAGEEKYRELVKHANSIVLRWNSKGAITFVNEFAQQFFGYTEEELIGKNVMGTIVPWPSREGVDLEKMIQDIWRKLPAFERNENENLRKNGERVWVSWSNQPIFAKSGELVELLSIGQDVTERKRAEEALRESEQQYRLLADNVSDVIFTMDLNLQFTYVSPSVERLFGWTAAEMQAFHPPDYMTPASVQLVFKILADELVLQGSPEVDPNRVRTLEIEQVRKDGTSFWTEVTTRFLYDSTGEPVGIIGATRDISARKRADKALQESEERFRLLFEGAADAFYLADLQGKLVDVNRTACESLGYTRDELLLMSVPDVEVGQQPDEMTQLWERIEERQSITVAGIHRRRDGSTFPVEIHVTPFTLGERPLMFGAARDISDRRQAEEALRANEERLRLAMQVSRQGWFDLNVQTGEADVSAEYARILGYEPGEFASNLQDWIAGLHPEDRETVLKRYRECLETGDTITMEYRRRTKTGDWKWLRSIGKVVEFDSENKPFRMAGTHADISERKRAEEALKESEAFRRRVFDSSRVPMIVMDGATFRYIDCNPAAAEIYGFSSIEEAIGKTPLDVSAALQSDGTPSAEKAHFYVKKALAEGMVVFEWRHQRSDGEIWDAEVHLMSFQAENRQFLQFTLQDITERKRAIEALRASEKKYRSVIENIQDVFYRSDAGGRLLMGSPSGARMFGYDSIEEMIGLPLDSFWPDPVGRQQLIAQIKANGSVRDFDAVLKRKDGSTFNALLTTHFYYDDNGDLLGTEGIIRDVTDRKRAEAETSSLRNYLENIINSMPSVLVGVDGVGKVTQWNAAAERVTGIPAKAAQGQFLEQVLPTLSHEREKIWQAIRDRAVMSETKVPHLMNGETRYEDVTVYPLAGGWGEGAVIRVDDVTERVRIEEMMVQSEKMLSVGGLAAGMAHEINNPLGAILQTSQNVLRRVSPDLVANIRTAEECGTTLEAVRRYLEQREILSFLEDIRISGIRAAQIVENMLAFSLKPDAEGSTTNLAELLDRTLLLAESDYDLKKRYDFRQIEIVREYAPDVPLVVCQASKVQQVFLNILRNGAEAMR